MIKIVDFREKIKIKIKQKVKSGKKNVKEEIP